MVSTELIVPPRPAVQVYGGLHALSNEHRQVEVPIGATIAEALEMALVDTGMDLPRDHFVATVDGERVPREYWHRVRPKPGTVVVFRLVASGDNALRSLLFLGVAIAALFIAPAIGFALGGFWAGATGTALIGGAITLAGALLVNALIPIRPPQQDTGQAKTLPMISGANNEARPWGAIPVVLGRHRLAPMYAAMPYSYWAGKDQHVNLLFCCGYGRLKITDLRIGNTRIYNAAGALINFEEIKTEIDEGNDNENIVQLFPSNVNELPMDITLRSKDLWVTNTTDINTKTISIDVLAPVGIGKYNTSNGKFEDRPVVVNVRYRLKNPNGTFGAYVSRPNITFTRNRDTYRLGDHWEVNPGQYEVQLQKATADYTGTEQVFDIVKWITLRSIATGRPILFPKPLALIGLRARATDQFNGVINTFNCICQSYVTAWNGSAWVPNTLSDGNPADLFLHVLTGPANARPRTAAQIDYDSLQRWSDDCRARGYTYNAVISDQRTVRDVLADIAAAGRATVALRNGKWGVAFPRDTDAVSWHFTPRNSSGMKSTRIYRELPHALRVRYIDASLDWRQIEKTVYADGHDPNRLPYTPPTLFESVEFPGITDWGNIHKAARYQIAQALLRPETHTLTADVESLRLERGDKVVMSSDTLLIGTGYGRVTSINVAAETIRVDNRVIMEVGKSYQIKFTLNDGTFLTRKVLNTGNETDLIYLDTSDNPPLASLQSIIADQGLTAGLKLLLEAGNSWSYSLGANANKWMDASGGHYDFYRGLGATAEASDPTFTGTVGAQTVNEYWSFDGGDFFNAVANASLGSPPPTWINRFHQAGAQFTAIFTVYIPTLNVNYFLWGNFANTQGTNIGSELVISSNTLLFYASRTGGANAYAVQSTFSIAAIGWHVFGVSIDEVNHTGTLMIDGQTMPLTPTYSAPSAAAATYNLQIGSAGNNAGPLPAGTRMRNAAMWSRSLTATQMVKVRDALVATHDLMPPVDALFSFGETSKVTKDYRVLDVRPGPDFTAQFMLVDDAPGTEFLDPIPNYDPGITDPPDPYNLTPQSLTYYERFEGSGITAKSTVQLTVIIPRVGTIRSFEFQYLDVTTGGVWLPFAVISAPFLTASKDNLEPGAYNFRVRSLFDADPVGQIGPNDASQWVYTGNVTVLGSNLRPPDVGGSLVINVTGDIMSLEWPPIVVANFAYYRVKYNPLTDGTATWANSTLLLTTSDNRAITATLAGTYMVKAVSFAGVESAIELQKILVLEPPVQPNIVDNISEAPYQNWDIDTLSWGPILGPSFPGSKYNTQVQDGVLLTLTKVGANYTTAQGWYQFADYIDLGQVYTSRITARVQAYGVTAGDTMDHWTTLASVAALDTADPSAWSIEMVYITSNGPTGKKSVRQRITDLGLDTGLKLCLEAAYSASWPGTGQKWLDISGGGYDFFLGSDAAASANDPSPPPAPNTLLRTSPPGAWYFDGGDWFTYDSVNEPWMNAIHQNNAKFSLVFSIFVPALDTGVGHYLMGNVTNGATDHGFQIRIVSGKPSFLTCAALVGGALSFYNESTLAITAAGWHTLGLSVDEAAGTLTWCLDDATQSVTGLAYTTPSAVAATYTTQIGAVGNGAGSTGFTNWYLHAALAWQGVALSATNLSNIVKGIHHNDDWIFPGPWIPYSVTDVTARIIAFGIRLNGSPDGQVSPAVHKLGVTCDMPDRHLGFDLGSPGTGSSINGTTFYFNPPFKKLRAVALANYNLDTTNGEKYEIVSKDESHVTILFSRNGNPIPGKYFTLHAYGYGAVVLGAG